MASLPKAIGCAFITQLIRSTSWRKEKREGKASRIALALMRLDVGILHELGYLPFSQAGGALLVHLTLQAVPAHLCGDHHQLEFIEWSAVFGNANITTALLDRFAHYCHIVETGNESH